MAVSKKRSSLSDAAKAAMSDENGPATIEYTPPAVTAGGSSPKPFYKKPWFIILAVFLLFALMGSCGSGGKSSTKSDESAEPPAAAEQAGQEVEETEEAPEEAEAEAPQADKSLLSTVFDSAKGLTNEGYTQDSWDSFQAVMAEAQAVMDDANASQERVDEMREAIGDAIIALFNPDAYEWPSYEAVARTPADWEYKSIAFSGEVLQVIDDPVECQIRLAVSGDYNSVILVAYSPKIMGDTRLLEDDTVTVYGVSMGIVSYTSTLGQQISVPSVYADKIILQ